jgi:hypothetical protein
VLLLALHDQRKAIMHRRYVSIRSLHEVHKWIHNGGIESVWLHFSCRSYSIFRIPLLLDAYSKFAELIWFLWYCSVKLRLNLQGFIKMGSRTKERGKLYEIQISLKSVTFIWNMITFNIQQSKLRNYLLGLYCMACASFCSSKFVFAINEDQS